MNVTKNYDIPLCEMLKEVRDDFDNIASLARSSAIFADRLDKEVFRIYDFISKVIPAHRSVLADDNFHVVNIDDYLSLLNDFEYIYGKIKELL